MVWQIYFLTALFTRSSNVHRAGKADHIQANAAADTPINNTPLCMHTAKC